MWCVNSHESSTPARINTSAVCGRATASTTPSMSRLAGRYRAVKLANGEGSIPWCVHNSNRANLSLTVRIYCPCAFIDQPGQSTIAPLAVCRGHKVNYGGKKKNLCLLISSRITTDHLFLGSCMA
ncbi:hypothetical protein PVAP13_2KG081732 [Panicum virgatum]|uniref:Uncharacterized protein n=1 Tax=Panicum virgatum TaxID=38727 RepID=A0A8T0VYS5_PANVG|nr:hypothetical protein PVAP13_2KG081732 [Panicum virgatum]